MAILILAAKEMKKNYRDREVRFDVVTDEAARIAEKIFPKTEARHIYEADI